MRSTIHSLLAGTVLLLGLTLVLPARADDPTGRLYVTARPTCHVYVDDVDHGTTEETRRGIDLPSGTYRVRFVCEHEDCDGFERRSGVKTLTVTAGKDTRYLADLYALNDRARGVQPTTPGPKAEERPSPSRLADPPRGDEGLGLMPTGELSPAATTGVLLLFAKPRCAVEIDGRFVGTTDRTRLGVELAPGTHRVRFLCEEEACADFFRRSGVKTLEVEAGETIRYLADFHALNARFSR